jgi:hypothetical protein
MPLENLKKLKAQFSKYFKLETKKNLFFFFFYSLFLILSVFFPSSPSLIFLGILTIFLWKIFYGLSWLNFNFFLFGLFEIKILASFLNPFWLFVFALVLVYLLFKKIFSFCIEETNRFKLFSFYYLFFFWVLISLGIYFFLNLPFIFSFLLFALGILIYSLIYFLIEEKAFYPNGLILILTNLEIFWLISYLNLPVSFLSIILFLNYWLTIYFFLKLDLES